MPKIIDIKDDYNEAHLKTVSYSPLILKAMRDLKSPIKSMAQWRTLNSLIEYGELDLTELSMLTGTLMPSLSRLIPELELQLLVKADIDDGDKRRLLVQITAKGKNAVSKVLNHWVEPNE